MSSSDTTHYSKDTAGHRMIRDVPVATAHQTVKEVHDMLAREGESYATINYVYVLDADKKLAGVMSFRDLFSSRMDTKIGDVCTKEPLVFVHPTAHQERAAYLALKHKIKAVPVVDADHRFLGEITSDAILHIMHKEMHEDALRRAGIRHPGALHANVLELSLFASLRHRIPWLILGLVGGLLAAKIVGFFEATLEKNILLAAFIPLIVYMSDAIGTQMEAYIIRDLAIDRSLPFPLYLLRHFLVVVAISLFLALLLYVSFGLFYHDWYMGFVIGVSLFAASASSVFTGLIIPYGFSRMTLDPADASGPFATIVQDMLSIIIYFSIATVLL